MDVINNYLSVFLVDDDKIFLLLLEHKLTQQFKNVRFFIYTSGEECLQHINDNPDVVVLDYYMNSESPNTMNGIEVLKKIKEINPAIQVVMMSAQDKLEVAVDAVKYGAYEYIVKSGSLFIRLQNVLKNIIYSIVSMRENKKYGKWNYIIGIFFFILVVIDIVYYIT